MNDDKLLQFQVIMLEIMEYNKQQLVARFPFLANHTLAEMRATLIGSEDEIAKRALLITFLYDLYNEK